MFCLLESRYLDAGEAFLQVSGTGRPHAGFDVLTALDFMVAD